MFVEQSAIKMLSPEQHYDVYGEQEGERYYILGPLWGDSQVFLCTMKIPLELIVILSQITSVCLML